MFIGKLKKSGLVAVSVIVTIAVGYILGGQAAGLFGGADVEKAREDRTKRILERMGSGLAVGKKLNDAVFFNLENNQVKLSQLLCKQSLIVYFDPECSFSALELQQIVRDVPYSARSRWLVREAFGDIFCSDQLLR